MQIQIIRAKTGAEVQYRNVFHAGYVIAKHHGVRGVFQGLGATIARDAPAFGVYFGVYEMVRSYMTPVGGTVADLSVTSMLLSGGAGGLLFWVFIYPADVIKSSMQSDAMDKSQRKYKNMIDCAKKLYLEEGGWRKFYRGFTPCIMRSIPANATQLFVLEKCRQLLS